MTTTPLRSRTWTAVDKSFGASQQNLSGEFGTTDKYPTPGDAA